MIGIERSGLILHAERYQACVDFYSEKVGLRIEFQRDEPGQILTIFDLGGAYLMLERGGAAVKGRKTERQNPVTLRFNVTDIENVTLGLCGMGVDVEIKHYDWGAIADFCDPDGNRCQLREAATFAR